MDVVFIRCVLISVHSQEVDPVFLLDVIIRYYDWSLFRAVHHFLLFNRYKGNININVNINVNINININVQVV